MTKVFLVRHGEAEGNTPEFPTFAGWDDKPLTPRGERQAAAVAQRLSGEQIAAVYASDLQRAWATAESIAKMHGLEVQRDPGLREVSYGEWEGQSARSIEAAWPDLQRRRDADPVHVKPPGGESYSDLWSRLQPSWFGILSRHPDQSIVIVAHNGSLRVALAHLMGMPLLFARRLQFSNCGLARVDIERVDGQEEHGVGIAFLNETDYLEGI